MITRRRLCATALTLLLAAGCKQKQAEAPRVDRFPVHVEPAGRRDMEETLNLLGSLKAKDEATLFSRVPGKLLANQVREGDPVVKGQAVALVERDEVGVRFVPAPVRSTLKGVVGRTYLDRGANVTTTTPVALIVDLSGVVARVDVPERHAARLKIGQVARVRVDAYPDRTFPGLIARVSPVVDPVTRSASIEVRIDNPKAMLRSGMFASVSVVVSAKPGVIAIPLDAIVEEGGPAIFAVENGKARRRPVTVGLRNETHAEIAGIEPGEQIITFGLFGLKDGSPVDVLAPEKAR